MSGVGFVDLGGLLTPQERGRMGFEEVLNGLAYDPADDVLYVTGKCWPKLFCVEVNTRRAVE